MPIIEKRYLPPLNPSTTITEADRSRVYGAIGKQLADILTGSQSYYPDGVQKDAQTQLSDLNRFIASIETLQGQADDPSNILGDSIKSLRDQTDRFQEKIKNEYPTDQMEIPPELSPATRDKNDIYVDPFPGPYSPPNPVMPKNWPKDLRVSFGSQGAEDASTGRKSSMPVLSKFIDGKRVMPSVDASPPFAPSNDPGSNDYPKGGGLAAWIAAAAGIVPNDPDRFSPSPQAQDINGFNRDNPAWPWCIQKR